jgi:hypothetical protein
MEHPVLLSVVIAIVGMAVFGLAAVAMLGATLLLGLAF